MVDFATLEATGPAHVVLGALESWLVYGGFLKCGYP